MADDEAQGAKGTGRGLRIALAVSLGLNLATAGLVGGTLLRARPPNPMVRDIGFGPFTAALSPEDRAALGQAFRNETPDLRGMRRDMRAEMAQLVQTLRSTPFDATALRAAIAVQDARGRARLELGQRLLADRLIAMTASERATFADRLEQGLERGRDRRRP